MGSLSTMKKTKQWFDRVTQEQGRKEKYYTRSSGKTSIMLLDWRWDLHNKKERCMKRPKERILQAERDTMTIVLSETENGVRWDFSSKQWPDSVLYNWLRLRLILLSFWTAMWRVCYSLWNGGNGIWGTPCCPDPVVL